MMAEPSFGLSLRSKQQANPIATVQPMSVIYGFLLRTAYAGTSLEASAGAETGDASQPISKSDHLSPPLQHSSGFRIIFEWIKFCDDIISNTVQGCDR
jgi:hypothetical protein